VPPPPVFNIFLSSKAQIFNRNCNKVQLSEGNGDHTDEIFVIIIYQAGSAVMP
jgi:hypothetical protein